MSDQNQPVRVAVVDYGLGNLFSVKHACEHVGMQADVTADGAELMAADGILLPGVGAFGDAMKSLEQHDLVNVLRRVAAAGKPLIGICLGMQLLMTESEEFGRHKGLNLLEGEVLRFNKPQGPRGQLKVPQVGWNRIYRPHGAAADLWDETPLRGLSEGACQYFVHSYCVTPQRAADVLSVTRYGNVEYCSAVRRGNVMGFQFHPERSGPAGLHIYSMISQFVRRFTSATEGRNAA